MLAPWRHYHHHLARSGPIRADPAHGRADSGQFGPIWTSSGRFGPRPGNCGSDQRGVSCRHSARTARPLT